MGNPSVSTGEFVCRCLSWGLSYQSGVWTTARAESHALHAAFHVRVSSTSGDGHWGDAIWRRHRVRGLIIVILRMSQGLEPRLPSYSWAFACFRACLLLCPCV